MSQQKFQALPAVTAPIEEAPLLVQPELMLKSTSSFQFTQFIVEGVWGDLLLALVYSAYYVPALVFPFRLELRFGSRFYNFPAYCTLVVVQKLSIVLRH